MKRAGNLIKTSVSFKTFMCDNHCYCEITDVMLGFFFHLLSTRPVTFLVTSCSTFIYRSTLNLYTFFSTSSISIGNSIIILNFTSLSAIVAKTYRIYVHIKIIRIIKFCFHNFWSCGYIYFFSLKGFYLKIFCFN